MATHDAAPACRVIHAADAQRSKQDLSYIPAVSAESAGARGLCMQRVTMPPGGRARPHLHADHESAVYVLSGRAAMWWGDGLRERIEGGPGDFFYVPANVPHLPVNLSRTEPCVAIIARTDPNEQESVVLLPELDAVAARLTA
jgi:uncharacterized RmlC-like cupin family protein